MAAITVLPLPLNSVVGRQQYRVNLGCRTRRMCHEMNVAGLFLNIGHDRIISGSKE